ncbi:glycosyltransferase family 39 protein [Oricola sp.]|uniref:glycosyltransferase family 39 protein n=1 Tax=Oricola sp. TaxID=1979950 RepID=UPI003BAA4C8F
MTETAFPPSRHPDSGRLAAPELVGLVAFVIGLTAIKLVVGGATGLVRDEAYYTLWALHPLQAGYFDHPPAVAWFIKAGQVVLGETELASRLVAILATPVCSLAIFRSANLLYSDQRTAALAVLWFNVTLGAAVGMLVITPDAPSMLFWTLAIWTAAELLRSGKAYWWLAFGIFAGLGLASKYTGAFLGAGIVLWIVWYRQNRRWLRSWQLYAGGALAVGLFSPVLWWNSQNGMSSLAFQLGRSARNFDIDLAKLKFLPEFVGSQIALLWPGLFLFAVIGCVLFFKRRGGQPNPGTGLLVVTALPAIAYFLYHATHARVQGNWPLPLYGQVAILGAWAAGNWQPVNGSLAAFMRFVRLSVTPLGLAIVLIVYAHAALGLFNLPVRDPSREMHGWDDAMVEISAIARKHAADTVFAPDYGMTGWLSVYNRFGNHGLTVLPAYQRHRYGYMALPEVSEVRWPALIAVRARRSRPAFAEFGKPPFLSGTFQQSIQRRDRHGTAIDRIDIYLADRPEAGIYAE